MTDRDARPLGLWGEPDPPGGGEAEPLGLWGEPDPPGGGEAEPSPALAGRPEWPPLVGGEGSLRQLEAALVAPVHAYLLTGTPGGDKRAVATVFAAELLAAAEAGQGAEAAERHRRRALMGVHPDVVLVEPEGRALLASEATSIITEAARRPMEGDRKVIVCDRFHTASPAVAASLLKTIEEPPAGTTIVLLADDIPPSHITVASRCVTVRFPAPSAEEMREWLVASGVPPGPARKAARAVAGDPGRARDLIAGGNLAERLEAWWSVPERLDGTGRAPRPPWTSCAPSSTPWQRGTGRALRPSIRVTAPRGRGAIVAPAGRATPSSDSGSRCWPSAIARSWRLPRCAFSGCRAGR